MKKKNKKAKPRKRNEFRFHSIKLFKDDGTFKKATHPAYVFLEKGNVYVYVTITHSDNVQNYLVIKLRKNPNPKDNNNAYYVAEIREDTKDRFGRRMKQWKIDDEDKKDIIEFTKKDDSADQPSQDD